MSISAYQKYESVILDDYGAADILQKTVLSLFNGYVYPIPLLQIAQLDVCHYDIFQELLAEYRQHGETPELLALAHCILGRYPNHIHQ